jgi:hypothetical protein
MEDMLMYLNELEQPELLPIGTRVVKRSGRPFKSTFWINTIKGYTNNPQTGRPAYTFEEDDSNVECFRCIKEGKENTHS